jgi:hypothetical protein
MPERAREQISPSDKFDRENSPRWEFCLGWLDAWKFEPKLIVWPSCAIQLRWAKGRAFHGEFPSPLPMLRLAKAVAFIIGLRGKVFAWHRSIETGPKVSNGLLILLSHISFGHWEFLPALQCLVRKGGVYGRRLITANEQ